MTPETIVVIMIGSLLLLLALGLPLAFLTGGIGTVILWFLFGHSFFISMITTILGSSTNILYAAVLSLFSWAPFWRVRVLQKTFLPRSMHGWE